MIKRRVDSEEEMNTIMAVMLRSLLLEKLGSARAGNEMFSYAAAMENSDSGEKETFMVSFDGEGNFGIDQIENDKFPAKSILIFSESKEDAIMGAAEHGGMFHIDEGPEEPDPYN